MPILLGYGYSDITGDDKSLKIFPECPINLISNPEMEYFCSAYESEEDYLKKLASSTSLKVPFNLTENLSAAFKYSKENESKQNEVLYIITISAIEKTEQIKLSRDIISSPEVQAAIAELALSKYNFYSKFGNAFVSDIVYGNEATITIKFKNVTAGVKQQLDVALKANIADAVGIETSQRFNRIINENNISHETHIHTSGFMAGQLPDMAVNVFGLKKWINAFQKHFTEQPVGAATHIVRYKTTPYTEVLGEAANPLLDKKLQANLYYDVIKRCKDSIRLYTVYHNSISRESNALHDLSLQEQALLRIEKQLQESQDFTNSSIIQALGKLQEIISYLNAMQLKPKVYEFNSSTILNFDVATCGAMRYRYTSPSFQLKLPEPLACNRLFVSVASTAPLPGRLTFLYSGHPHVPYDSMCSSLSVPLQANLNLGEPIAVDLPENGNLQNIYLAFHYEIRRKKYSPVKHPFTYKALLEYKLADAILPIDVPRSPRAIL